MIDLCLRADTAKALVKACPWLRNEDGEWIVAGEGFAFDPIGALEDDDRFHANLRCDYEIAKTVPQNVRCRPRERSRVWA